MTEKKSGIDHIEDEVLNACSAYDCTGLIPSAPTNDAEAQAYEELYPYLSPEIKPKNSEKKTKK